MTPDVEAAKKFYGELFGWSHEDRPAGEYGFYTMFSKGDVDVAGMGAQPPDRAGMPPVWNSYILVEDADATTAKTAELAGTVIMPVMEVMDAGRMSIIQDPTGAFVSLWEAKEHGGAGTFNEQGALVWNELLTRDQEQAKAFYGDLLGWTYEEMDLGGEIRIPPTDISVGRFAVVSDPQGGTFTLFKGNNDPDME